MVTRMSMTKRIRCYTELKQLKTFEERFGYLKLAGQVGQDTFGFDRYLNQDFYRSRLWQDIRRIVIARDLGRDLGIEGREIEHGLEIHHMNPISKEDILEQSDYLLDPEYLICVSAQTHKAIHYGDRNGLLKLPQQRSPYDTVPWKQNERRSGHGIQDS